MINKCFTSTNSLKTNCCVNSNVCIRYIYKKKKKNDILVVFTWKVKSGETSEVSAVAPLKVTFLWNLLMGKRPASAFVCPLYPLCTLFTELLHSSECMHDACLFVLSALVRCRYQGKQLNLAEKVKKKKKEGRKATGRHVFILSRRRRFP